MVAQLRYVESPLLCRNKPALKTNFLLASAIIPIRIIRKQHSFFIVPAAPRTKKSAVLPIDSPERRRLPPLLRRSWYGLNQSFRRRIAHLEITPDQFTVLRILLENPGLSQRALTQLMTSDPNTVASLIERMESAGLIGCQPHEKDRRAHCLHLRPEGRKKYEQAREVALILQAEALSVLPQGKREEFLENLARVADACRAAAENSPKRQG